MLTPRRTMLLLAGFVLFSGAYAVYAQLLGWLDGLPQLPAKMLVRATGDFAPPPRDSSPTLQKIAEAFGENSPETNTTNYATQFEFRSGESSVVVAAGKVPNDPNSHRVTLTPFSVAIFSKPKPPHLRQPGEVTEISTIHADKGVLEFDRVIHNPADMGKKAKLVRVELVSDFGEALPDPRRGIVHITNNQRSSDPNRFLILRTVGPVFYRDPKSVAGTPAAQGPDFWTDAPVEIVDRQNLPRPIGSSAPVTVPTKSEENRNTGAIAAILNGNRLPPPTVTAIGLRVYLEPEPPPGQKKKEQKPGTVNGVRRLEFLEQVVMNLWIDNGQSLVGGAPAPVPGQPAPSKSSGLALVPPPAALAAVTGGLGPAAYNARLLNRALLQIDTRGPFAYDSEKSLARFDVVPHSDPNLPNDVQVTKIPSHGGLSSLFSQVLELEFNGGPTAAARPATNAPAIKRLHAWTSTPGRFLTLTSQDDSAEAYGQDLVHEQGASRTTLKGAPLYVVRERNVLSAGSAQAPATLTTEPGPPVPSPVPGQPPVRKQQMTVRGPGKVELFDEASKSNTVTATWLTSLVQSKELIAGREQDLFVFTDGAKFEDQKADFWLKGTVLKLWLEARADAPAPAGPEPKAAAGSPKPSLVHAIGQVRSHSTEYDIDEAEQLTVHIADPKPVPVGAGLAPPKPPESPTAVAVAPTPKPLPPVVGPMPPVVGPAPPGAGPVPPKQPEPLAKEPEKPKPPYKIRAKTIETFVTRVPVPPAPVVPGTKPAAPPKPGEAPPPAPAKYQLDHARCEDSVFVHQDPLDPTKPRGVDIIGRLLLIDGSPDGSVMTVFGSANTLGEVHQEEMSLLGPKVVLNQVLNSAAVEGRGALRMPTKSDFAGSELAQPEVIVVQWRDKMSFNGAQKSALFVGKVQAQQGESSVQCHTMNVVFDRPMYFNQTQKRAEAPKALAPADPKNPAAGAKKDESAKIDKVFCYPAPADSADNRSELEVIYVQVDYDKTGKLIKAQRLRVQELKLEAQAQDPNGGEKYQRVVAEGPGTLRTWQMGEANAAGPSGGAPPPKPMQPVPPGAKPPAKDDDQEMKLTIIDFKGRMTGVDKGKVFQTATFGEDVKVINVPADSPTLQVDKNNLPPRAVLLTCTKELVVWSEKKGTAAPLQRMDAFGNGYVRTDEYDGSAEKISSEGKTVTLTGSETLPARIMKRFGGGTEQSGRVIIYDRGAGTYRVIDGFGGSINPNKK